MDLTGAELARHYYEQVVRPVLRERWPDLPHAAGRLGSGSDVLGLDDATSRDHDWGLRLNLVVPAELVGAVNAALSDELPETWAGRATRFATTWDPVVRHRVQVETAGELARSRLGLDPSMGMGVADWLALTGQAVLEVTSGELFVDGTGELSGIRRLLEWYPDDLWRHVVAVDWVRLGQELPFIGRTAERGDDLGSRVIAARLAGVAMHLAHLLERRWPPYAKWLGTSLDGLPQGSGVTGPLEESLAAAHWREREGGLAEAARALMRLQSGAGLPSVAEPLEPFFDRPYQGVRAEVTAVLEQSVTDPEVRALPRGVGSVEQWSDNVDVLVHPRRRRGMPGAGGVT